MPARIIHTRRRRARLALPSLLALAGSACAHAQAPSSATAAQCPASFDAAAVTAVLDAQREAWNAGELDGFLAGYERSEALLFTSGAKIRRGYAQTRDKYRARYGEAPETMGTLAFEILDVRPLGRCKDAAVVLGRWALSETPETGSGVFSVILERQVDDGGDGDAWRIVHDHTSAE